MRLCLREDGSSEDHNHELRRRYVVIFLKYGYTGLTIPSFTDVTLTLNIGDALTENPSASYPTRYANVGRDVQEPLSSEKTPSLLKMADVSSDNPFASFSTRYHNLACDVQEPDSEEVKMLIGGFIAALAFMGLFTLFSWAVELVRNYCHANV